MGGGALVDRNVKEEIKKVFVDVAAAAAAAAVVVVRV